MENPLSRHHIAKVLIDITDDDQLSTAANIQGWRVVAVALPDALTGSALTFQIDPGDGTYRTVEDFDGTELSVTIAADKVVQIGDTDAGPIHLVGVNIKVKSGSAEGGDRVVYLLCVPA